MKDSDKQSLIAIFWTIGGLFAVLFYGGALHDFLENGPKFFTKDNVLSLLLVTAFALCMMYRFRRIVYYGVAVMYYGLAVVTVLSLVGCVSENVVSFLTAPIGIKPEFQVGAFADAFSPLLLVTAVVGAIYFIAKSVREKTKDLQTAGVPSPPQPAPSGLNVKSTSE